MKRISLNGEWRLRGREQDVPQGRELALSASVPGCVQLDLAQQGYLPKDLFMGENIKQAEAFECWEWWYERKFAAPAEREGVWLVFEGVDCLAEYTLNGHPIGKSENALIAHEFEVGHYLQDGENTLVVHLTSPVLAAHEQDYTVHAMLSYGGGAIETAVRRAPHSYGWDIMPRAVTVGLWRDVRLEVRDTAYFSQLFFHVDQTHAMAMFELCCPYGELSHAEVVLRGQCGADSAFEQRVRVGYSKVGRVKLDIPNPKSWWPCGYGEPHLSEVCAEILLDGVCVHKEHTHFGLRSVELDRSDTTDGENGRFRFLINGTEILCKGSNWVPLDAFHSRDAERYARALELVKDVGCNILRCWGGNVYEDHAFFDFCDRNGILVWQDFAMACRIYPETDCFKELLRAEATAVVRKLRNHPSILLWSGDNEVDELLQRYVDPACNSLTREVLPKVVQLNDTTRPYLASSPYVSKKGGLSIAPEQHLWGPRDYFKSAYYQENKAHFVSETGYHGCPSLDSIRKFITPERVWPYTDNPEWILHSSDQKGNDARVMLMEKQVRQLFGEVPSDPEEYVLASQISQAEAKKYFTERVRVARPQKSGIIWWNLLDGWPQMSDAVVDYYFNKKLAYAYIKRAQAPFVIAAGEIQNWGIKLYACNDTRTQKCGHFSVRDAESGALQLEGDFTAAINTTTVIGKLPVYYSEHKMLIIEWEVNGVRGRNHYLCAYPPISLAQYRRWMAQYDLGESDDVRTGL